MQAGYQGSPTAPRGRNRVDIITLILVVIIVALVVSMSFTLYNAGKTERTLNSRMQFDQHLLQTQQELDLAIQNIQQFGQGQYEGSLLGNLTLAQPPGPYALQLILNYSSPKTLFVPALKITLYTPSGDEVRLYYSSSPYSTGTVTFESMNETFTSNVSPLTGYVKILIFAQKPMYPFDYVGSYVNIAYALGGGDLTYTVK